MSKKNYVHNSQPVFIPPKNEKKRSKFVYYAMKKAFQIDISKSELNHTLLAIDPKTGNVLPRFRKLNKHRAYAMKAMVLAMLYYYNIHSNIVEASIEKLSDECGLSTVSQAGNKSITRASRLITHFMEPMGFVKRKKRGGKFIKKYRFTRIFLTPMFFMLIQISQSKINQHKKEKLDQILKKREKKIFISFSDIKIISELDEKSAKSKILKALINYYTASELTKIGPQGLKKKIDIEYSNLCKLYKNNK
ncbi:replication protein RepA (plasmid) [Buchnera aphidicola (Melanaphis sacchari)]|uniref:Replication protein RepA n=1 Tax=Buchnera aphidicola (Melanaphis sacchari) TaxID=2173854 RepID=A0A2U8DHV9_9GAMM|nr:plasmid replication initiator RepA [Buchnera aphidicola]AWH90784.1 replication protein RepA [Buchnera aphidicola (Melanaphis sacchari)]